VDDVLTSGVSPRIEPVVLGRLLSLSLCESQKAVREAIELVQSHPEAKLVGILQLVDRQERGGKSDLSTVQEIEKEFKVPVVPIIDFEDIIRYAETRGDMREQVESMQSYRNEWGIKPSA
jgi:orotate phosphoribosyltransferase